MRHPPYAWWELPLDWVSVVLLLGALVLISYSEHFRWRMFTRATIVAVLAVFALEAWMPLGGLLAVIAGLFGSLALVVVAIVVLVTPSALPGITSASS